MHDNFSDPIITYLSLYSYPAAVQMAGGTCSFVPIELNTTTSKWEVDFAKLEAAITPKTKVLLLNTPHNPTGKVFTREELEQVAGILRRHPHVIAISDEVYEKLVYDGREHVRLASLPDMWDRADHLLLWQDLLLHGMESGMGLRRGTAGESRRAGQPVGSLLREHPHTACHGDHPH